MTAADAEAPLSMNRKRSTSACKSAPSRSCRASLKRSLNRPSQHGLAGHVPEIVEPAAQPLDGGRILSALERLFGIFQRRPRFARLAADGKGPQTDAGDREQQPGRQAAESLRLAAAPFPPALGKAAVGHAGQRQIGQVAPQIFG